MTKKRAEEDNNKSIFKNMEAISEEEKRNGLLSRMWWKITVIMVLLIAVIAIIASKEGDSGNEQVKSGQAGGTVEADDSAEDGNNFPPETVLATVNEENITLAELEKALEEMPRQYQSAFKNNRHGLLKQLVSRELLLQEAQQTKAGQKKDEDTDIRKDNTTESHPQTDDERINALLQREVLNNVKVTEEDVKAFYEKHKDEMPDGRDFEEFKPSLREYARQEKQNDATDTYLSELQETAEITLNQDWIDAQKTRAANNPLDKALKKDVPVLADFGQDSCAPCKMMKPILDDLKQEYEGRAEILIIQTDEYPDITERVGVRAIPTQIFYDSDGEEQSRHQGFMPREDIVKKLREMGVKNPSTEKN